MRNRRRALALAGLVLGLGACFALAETASATGDISAPFPECTPDGGQQGQCAAGWYTGPVTVIWNPNGGTPTANGGCSSGYYPQDTDQSSLQSLPPSAYCTVGLPGGVTVTVPYRIKVEVSAPTATALPNRPPDFKGWYNHPVTAQVGGSAFSGIRSCTPTTYAGPYTTTATVGGTCTDNAGKIASTTSLPFPYDATAPPLQVAADPGDRTVALHWRGPANLVSLKIVRTPGVGGGAGGALYRSPSGVYHDGRVHDGVRYRYTLTARDQAGNVTVRTLVVTPGPRLVAPAPDAPVTAPPVLRWTPVRGAGYYNVQLYRGDKILSAWPSRASLRLTRVWSFAGRRYRLKRGRYRWYVWPGFGARSAARYGAALGSRSFVVG